MKNKAGILYFTIHLLIEVTTFYVLSSLTDNHSIIWGIAILYDYFAFMPQGLYGYLSDRGFRINFAVVGTVIAVIALALFALHGPHYLIAFVLAIGNGMIHVQGAEVTLRTSGGRMTPSALFVAGGSFGLIAGKILAMAEVSPLLVLALHLCILPAALLAEKQRSAADSTEGFRYNNPAISATAVIILATLVVVVRAYMGYGIPTTWNRTLIQTVFLYTAMGVGKALGGVCIDRFGIRITGLVSTIGALPFLLLGDRVMMVSLFGIMLFSMTMAITLGLLVSVLKKYPGVAFGLTTIGLFFGTLPIFFFRIRSVAVNCIVVTVLTLLSMGILGLLCEKGKRDDDVVRMEGKQEKC